MKKQQGFNKWFNLAEHNKMMKDEGYKDKFNAKLKEHGVSSVGELKTKYDEGKQKQFWEEVDSLKTTSEEGGVKKAHNDDDSKKNEDYTLGDRYKAYKGGGKKMSYKAEDDEESELSDEEVEILYYIDDIIGEKGEASMKEISEEEGNADEHTMETLQMLSNKHLIEMDDEGNITEITDTGQEMLREYGEMGDPHDENDNGEEDMNNNGEEEDNNKMNVNGKEDHEYEDDDPQGRMKIEGDGAHVGKPKMDENGKKEEEGSENGEAKMGINGKPEMGKKKIDMNGDGSEKEGEYEGAGEEASEEEGGASEEEDGAGEGEGGDNMQMDEEKLKMHAHATPTEKLEEYVENDENPDNLQEIAQSELDDREDGDSDGGMNDNDKFDKFIENHFDEHDIEDLQEYTKGLIKTIPGEIKTLKTHYRNEYPTKNKGNAVTGKIDGEEFETYVDEYLEAKPFEHLKEYAKALLTKNPDAYKAMQGKYQAHADMK